MTGRLSQERLSSISLFTKHPQLRKRSISDSNLLNSKLFSDTNLFGDGNPQEHFRYYTSTSVPRNRSNLRKRSISESELHRLTILFDKPSTATKTVHNRKTHCLGIREEEECDGAEENSVIEEEREVNKENTRKSDINKDDIKKELQQDQQPQTQRKRKNGFSSFSLAKFMTGKIRTRTQSYEPDDPRQLILAIRNRDINRVHYILDNCPVDVNGCNSKGVTPLQEAALDGQFNIIELLLQYNAEVNQTDGDGLTCLDYAVFGGHFECASYLIGKGATVSSVRDGMPIF